MTHAAADTGRAARPPIRTCVGCRAAVPQAELVRIATAQGRAVADPGRRMPGRGADVHARPASLVAAGKGGLARSLRRNVSRAELDGLSRAVGGTPVAEATPAGGRPGRDDRVAAAVPGDPGIITPGESDADAVENGSASSVPVMSNPRPTSAANATGSTTSTGGAERSR